MHYVVSNAVNEILISM